MSPLTDGYNEKVRQYDRLMECYASRTMSGGRENLYASRIVNTNEIVYTIRWREGITPSMYVKERGEMMKIESVHEEGRRYRLHIKVLLTDSGDA